MSDDEKPFPPLLANYPGPLERDPTPVTGTCCACGYSGSDTTDCPKMEDGVHCNHWHDGEDSET